MAKHYTAATDTDFFSHTGDRRNHDFRARIGKMDTVMVFGDPVTVIAELIAQLC